MYQNTELNRDDSELFFLSLIFYQHPCQVYRKLKLAVSDVSKFECCKRERKGGRH